MPLAAITTTPSGLKKLIPIYQTLTAHLWIPANLSAEADQLGLSHQAYASGLRELLSAQWQTYDGFIFCLTTGAVVRLIAPLLKDKATDPAIVVLDEAGQFVISLCGGHQGGADLLTQQVSHCLSSQPVITGAAHRLDLPAIDTLGRPFGWVKGSGDWTQVSAALARSAPIQVIQEAGSPLWQAHLPARHPFYFGFPELQDRNTMPSPQARVWISPIQRRFSETSDLPRVQWHPRVLWVGIGCERGTAQALLEFAIEQVLARHHLAVDAIAGIATLDLKANEPGLVDLCKTRHWPLRCFAASALAPIPVPNPSVAVETAVGTPSVAEAAALLASQTPNHWPGDPLPTSPPPHLPTSPPPHLPTSLLRVPKQIFRHPDHPGAVTIAIAQAEQEYTGRTGQLLLVGTGPGSLDQITPAARTAISQADVVIGYTLYIELIRSLLRPGQIVERLPITQEKQRALRAIELARWGLTVAVVSSGDCGIYGMAGLVLELLKEQGWDGQTPVVQVLPGISALQAAASRVGAPLMHDFCAISLSDLLTPWEVIQRRLTAVAQADFIVALYNPQSKTRTEPLRIAREIFLNHRDPQTPVALARSLYRPDEKITLTTLTEMLTHPIDMVTTVLIGNQSSLTHAGWFITPRGYLGHSG
jgi:cobalt-precorrin 5A hydrolase/precorrin-3B C17-methyltransferase